VLIQKAFKFKLESKPWQERLFRRQAGCTRLVWNTALDLTVNRLHTGEKTLGYAKLCQQLTEWKSVKEFHFLNEVHSQPLQQTLKHLTRAISDFFSKDPSRKKEAPRFKKKGEADTFTFPQGCCKLDERNKRVFLPKIGWVRYQSNESPHKRRFVTGDISNVTVSLHAAAWYVSIQTEREVDDPVHSKRDPVGIDQGIARFATLSTGEFFDALNSFRKLENKLARAQRKLSKKTLYSVNWYKAKARVERIHACIANARRDYLHKTSTQICKNHAVVVLEDLNVRNMSASARGTIEKPGQNVAAKSGLNKGILDQGWGEFRRQLEYKLNWRGGLLVMVPPQHTSQTAPSAQTGGHSRLHVAPP
jgi:putative transposase